MNPIVARLYWQLMALLLACRLVGWRPALAMALALGVVQALHYAWVRRGWRARDVQVRLDFLALLACGLPAATAWLHALQLGGVLLLLVADYCVLARLLDLAAWNRDQPLSAALIRRALLTPPAQRGKAGGLASSARCDGAASPAQDSARSRIRSSA